MWRQQPADQSDYDVSPGLRAKLGVGWEIEADVGSDCVAFTYTNNNVEWRATRTGATSDLSANDMHTRLLAARLAS
jgi:hypothetical protein